MEQVWLSLWMERGPCLLWCWYLQGDCKGWVASGGGGGLVLASSEQQQLVQRLGLGEAVEQRQMPEVWILSTDNPLALGLVSYPPHLTWGNWDLPITHPCVLSVYAMAQQKPRLSPVPPMSVTLHVEPAAGGAGFPLLPSAF